MLDGFSFVKQVMGLERNITRLKKHSFLERFPPSFVKNRCLVEGCVEEISNLIKYEFNSYWRRCYKEVVLIDYFAREFKFPIFKYKIRVWNEQAKKLL